METTKALVFISDVRLFVLKRPLVDDSLNIIIGRNLFENVSNIYDAYQLVNFA